AHDEALDDGALLVKRCGYFFLNWSSRSHVNSGPLLEFHRTLINGMRLRFNRLTSRLDTGMYMNLLSSPGSSELVSNLSTSNTLKGPTYWGLTSRLQNVTSPFPRRDFKLNFIPDLEFHRFTLQIGVTLLSITSGLHPLLDLDDFLSGLLIFVL
ncbi:hypothetical protein Tco_0625770, partial [Tanacetum coccineum]